MADRQELVRALESRFGALPRPEFRGQLRLEIPRDQLLVAPLLDNHGWPNKNLHS